jgi:hypothetical protein
MDAWVLARAAQLLFRMNPLALWNLFHQSEEAETGRQAVND